MLKSQSYTSIIPDSSLTAQTNELGVKSLNLNLVNQFRIGITFFIKILDILNPTNMKIKFTPTKCINQLECNT